jgi:hypothetical protein
MITIKPLYLRDQPYEEWHDSRTGRKGHETQSWVDAPVAAYRHFMS